MYVCVVEEKKEETEDRKGKKMSMHFHKAKWNIDK
jgi:hypothetical protein